MLPIAEKIADSKLSKMFERYWYRFEWLPELCRNMNIVSTSMQDFFLTSKSCNFRGCFLLSSIINMVKMHCWCFSHSHYESMACKYRIFDPLSDDQARCIPRTVEWGSQPVQVHVCSRSSAADIGDHRLHDWTGRRCADEGNAVQTRCQSLQGT